MDEYRIRGHVEFHARRPNGTDLPEWGGKWRELTADDILLHLMLHTPVAEWLTARLPQRARPGSFMQPAVAAAPRSREPK